MRHILKSVYKPVNTRGDFTAFFVPGNSFFSNFERPKTAALESNQRYTQMVEPMVYINKTGLSANAKTSHGEEQKK